MINTKNTLSLQKTMMPYKNRIIDLNKLFKTSLWRKINLINSITASNKKLTSYKKNTTN